MTPQQCFGVVIRAFGLFLLLLSLYFFLTAAYVHFVTLSRPHSPPSAYGLYGVVSGLVSLYLLRGAPGLAGFCYPRSSGPEQASD